MPFERNVKNKSSPGRYYRRILPSMLSGNRLHNLALGGFLTAVILFSSSALGQTDKPEDKTPNSQPATTQAEPAKPTVATPAPNEPPSAEQYKAICDNPKDAQERDLCQQWHMAEAAKKQAEWTKRQFWITAAEVVGLLVIVIFTASTAKAADRSARAAEDVVRATEKTAERQLRAYVFVEESKRALLKTGGPWVIDTKIKNFGQTPAYKLRVRIAKLIADRSVAPEILLPEQAQLAEFDLGPGHDFTLQLELPELRDTNVWNDFKAKKKVIFVSGRIDFVDAFDKERWTTFCLYQDGGPILNFLHYPKGNETSESQPAHK